MHVRKNVEDWIVRANVPLTPKHRLCVPQMGTCTWMSVEPSAMMSLWIYGLNVTVP